MKTIIITKRNKFLLGLTAILLTRTLLISGCVEAEVSIVSNKGEYEQGEIITITIRNNLKESILVHTKGSTPGFCIENIEIKNTEKHWEGLLTHFPDCVSDVDPSRGTEPGQSITFEWVPSMIDYTGEAVQLNPGRYRLSVIYMSCEMTEWISIYTNEFTIK